MFYIGGKMKQKVITKLNIRSESGFTMQDLIVAMILMTVFVGTIAGLMYSSYKLNYESRVAAQAVNYSVQILEDIDKIPYEDVQSSLAQSYVSKFSIPAGYQVNLEVSNYNEGNNKADVIKIVKLTISYTFGGNTENIIIQRLKVKEV